jgi:hypothetical protein
VSGVRWCTPPKALHSPQHHEGREEEGGGVGEALALDVGGGTVHGLEDGGVFTDVAGGGKTQTADQAGRQVRENVTVPAVRYYL